MAVQPCRESIPINIKNTEKSKFTDITESVMDLSYISSSRLSEKVGKYKIQDLKSLHWNKEIITGLFL